MCFVLLKVLHIYLGGCFTDEVGQMVLILLSKKQIRGQIVKEVAIKIFRKANFCVANKKESSCSIVAVVYSVHWLCKQKGHLRFMLTGISFLIYLVCM